MSSRLSGTDGAPTAWLTWALGRPVPGDEDDKYSSSGYRIQDFGPKYFEGKGQKAVEQTHRTRRRGGWM